MSWMTQAEREVLFGFLRTRTQPDATTTPQIQTTTATTAIVKEQRPQWDACPKLDHQKENTVWPFWWYFERVLHKAQIPENLYIGRMLTCPKIAEPTQNAIATLLQKLKEQNHPDATNYQAFQLRICRQWGWVDPERECLHAMNKIRAPDKLSFRNKIEDMYNVYLRIRRWKGRTDHDTSILLKYYYDHLPETVADELRQEASDLLRANANGSEVYEKIVRKMPIKFGSEILEDATATPTKAAQAMEKFRGRQFEGRQRQRNEGAKDSDIKRQKTQSSGPQSRKDGQPFQRYQDDPQKRTQTDTRPRSRNRRCWFCNQRDCPDRRKCQQDARNARAKAVKDKESSLDRGSKLQDRSRSPIVLTDDDTPRSVNSNVRYQSKQYELRPELTETHIKAQTIIRKQQEEREPRREVADVIQTVKIGVINRPEAIIMVRIDNTMRTALQDTGATRSFLRPGITTNTRKSSGIEVELADNSIKKIELEAEVHIKIGEAEVNHVFLIMEGLTTDCIIGMDLMRKMDITVRASQDEITVKGESIKFIRRKLAKRIERECKLSIKTSLCSQENPRKEFCLFAKLKGITVETTEPENAWENSVMETNLTDKQRKLMRAFLAARNEYFANKLKPLGQINMRYAHRVKPSGNPIKRKIKPLSPAMIEEQSKQLKKMLELGVIQPSASDWAAIPSFSPKKDGTWRFNINFRGINKRCEADSYPIPRAPDLLETFEGMNWFSKLDASMGYWQVPIHPEDRKYCSFICQEGQFEFCRMSFGLMNAPATYQRMNDDVLKTVLRKFAVVYIDDVMVYSKTFEEHMEHLRVVMDLVYQSGQLLRADKCDFCKREVEYLGHMVGSGGRRMCTAKLRKILGLPRPHDKESIRRFLGITGYYRAYIKDYARIANPLTELTKQDNQFNWNEECEQAFLILQKEFEKNAVLEYPDYSKTFIIECDASGTGVGAVLLQETTRNGVKKDLPVFFASRKLTPGERKWPIRDKEALAIVWALATFRHHILGRHFIVRSDHQSLEWLMEAKTGRLARWSLMLSEYEPFTIQYKSGKVNKKADALSRIYESSEILPEIATVAAIGMKHSQPTGISNKIEEWKIRFMEATPSKPNLIRTQRLDNFCLKRISNPAEYPTFIVQDQILGITVAGKFKPVLPLIYVDQVIKAIHHNPLSAHMGVKRTAARVAELFVIPKLRQHVQRIVGGCQICLSRKQPIQRAGWLASKPPTKIWEQVAMDFAGPYPESNEYNQYVLVMVDNFSKYVEIVPCKHMDAITVINAFYERIICRHGCPERILSDNHRHFKNTALRSVCDIFGIYPAYITPYYPQGNGQAERFMRNLNDSISMLCDNLTDDWCSYIPGVQFAYNTSVHSVTGITPFFMNHGRNPRMPYEQEYQPDVQGRVTRMKYLRRMRNVIANSHRFATDKCREAWLHLATAYNRTRKDIKVEIGQWVLIRNTPVSLQPLESGRKLPLKWSEPMKVTAVRTSGKAFEVEAWDGTKRMVNISRLLPIPPDSWKPDKIQIQSIFKEVADNYTLRDDTFAEDLEDDDQAWYITERRVTTIHHPQPVSTTLPKEIPQVEERLHAQPEQPNPLPESIVTIDPTADPKQAATASAFDDADGWDDDIVVVIEEDPTAWEHPNVETIGNIADTPNMSPGNVSAPGEVPRYYTRRQKQLDIDCGKDVSDKLLAEYQPKRQSRRQR